MAQLLFEVLTVNVYEMRLFGPRHALITYLKYRATDIATVDTILNLIVCDAVWAENHYFTSSQRCADALRDTLQSQVQLEIILIVKNA